MWFTRDSKARQTVYTLARILLGAVFVYASWDKLLNPSAFADIIANYQIVSASTGNLAALYLPWLELVCGASLIINRWSRSSALVAAGMMVVFMAALGYNFYRGIDVNCGCFTLDETPPGSMWYYLARDAVFLTMAVGIAIHRQPGCQTPKPAQRPG